MISQVKITPEYDLSDRIRFIYRYLRKVNSLFRVLLIFVVIFYQVREENDEMQIVACRQYVSQNAFNDFVQLHIKNLHALSKDLKEHRKD